MSSDKIPSYKPSAFYFRRALREADSVEAAVEAGLLAVDELECLKAWVRKQGLIPPKQHILQEEAQSKGWI